MIRQALLLKHTEVLRGREMVKATFSPDNSTAYKNLLIHVKIRYKILQNRFKNQICSTHISGRLLCDVSTAILLFLLLLYVSQSFFGSNHFICWKDNFLEL